MYSVYTALLVIYALFRLPPMAYAAWRRGKRTGDIRQRWGRLPAAVNPDGRPAIWIHAVSVGETLAAYPLIRALRRAYPDHRLVLSTTTVTGQAVAGRLLESDAVDAVIYAPFDFAGPVARALDRIAPRLLVLIDTELWPTLLRACRRRGVRTLVANGRISDRSFARYRLVRGFMGRVLSNVDRICAQTDEWGERFVDIGADPGRVTVTGSLKFDAATARRDDAPAGDTPTTGDTLAAGDDPLLAAFAFAHGRPVVIAASTLEGEEDPALRAFARIREKRPDALLIIAPRHPERFDDAHARAQRAGFPVVRRSALPPGAAPDMGPGAGPSADPGAGQRADPGADPGADVVILDTMGELAGLFPIATAVFVGGSLARAGGHNVLEPAAAGRAIVVGPHMENFAEVTRQLAAAGGLLQARDAAELETMLAELVADDARRAALGAAARTVVETNRGATERTMAAVADLLPC